MIRRAVVVRGVVQGVGFRPFVYGLATDLGLTGFVRNETDRLLIEVEGSTTKLDAFVSALRTQAPPLARIDAIETDVRTPLGDSAFRIAASESGTGTVQLSPDVATCADCLRELFDPNDRRFGYPFINCTNCGPRLTIIHGAPYDRRRTTMARFAMCARCQVEYDEPSNRRFHAQPNACAACGPALSLHGRSSSDPIADVAGALRDGQIVALKGLGGFHLACDATNRRAVVALRERKARDEKPFAVMAADLACAERLGNVSPAEREALASHEHPIVLVGRRPDGGLADEVAPGNPRVGLMLPYTPLHHVLMRAMDGRPLVMTSGNRSDEPIAYDDSDAVERLRDIADLIVVHDRPIHTRCDDSVMRVIADSPVILRRARGFAPRTLRLPAACGRPILALGGHVKATFAFGRDDRALLGHHVGDLDDQRTWQSYVEAIAHYERVFEIAPELLVHDLHPEYASTRYARERGLPALAVQHHHAHVASCMVEHGLVDPVIGVAFDGAGYGSDGTLWGGELLLADLRGFERAYHLREVPLPGGEQAIREPWRMALSHLHAAHTVEALDRLLPCVPSTARRMVTRMIEQRLNAPMTSSMGRLFDAIASIAGVRDRTTFEGQAAMELESVAETVGPDHAYDFAIEGNQIDPGPVVCAAAGDRVAGVSPARIARRFHEAVCDVVATAAARIRERSAVNDVVLTGGVFQNALVTTGVADRLRARGFVVHRHREVPPNDGGLALGQLAIAAARGAL